VLAIEKAGEVLAAVGTGVAADAFTLAAEALSGKERKPNGG